MYFSAITELHKESIFCEDTHVCEFAAKLNNTKTYVVSAEIHEHWNNQKLVSIDSVMYKL
ncbi:MAG: hypothetical protein ACRCZB_09370 [Bacteroidales bacterium]